MKSNKDISDLFREHKNLEVQPSPMAWRKLERKLNNHRNRGRRNIQRLMAMAAAMLVLIVFVLLLTMVAGQNQPNYVAVNEYAPRNLEELVTTDVDLEALRVVSITHNLADRMAQPISEGKADRMLVPAGSDSAENSRTSRQLEEKVAHLTDFSWLLGQWEGRADGKKSIERWQKLNAQNYRGIGMIIQRRDTIFQETILLEDNGEELMLWVQLAENGRSYPFALDSYEDNKAVFVNPEMTFPQEIHLTQDGAHALSMVYLNAEATNLSEEQVDFLRRRNSFTPQQIKRKLERKEVK